VRQLPNRRLRLIGTIIVSRQLYTPREAGNAATSKYLVLDERCRVEDLDI
jgi:hypothetical protein